MGLVISIKYLAMQGVAKEFEDCAASMKKLLNDVQTQHQPLKSGAWIADAADDFYKSMDSEIFPAMERLHATLTKASQTTQDMNTTMSKSEENAKACIPSS